MTPKISVIIATRNTRQLLIDCLTSLLSENGHDGFEVVVVDNASSDGTAEAVRSQFGDVALIENRENVGFSRANNQGAARASGELLLFLNSDTLARPEAIRELAARMAAEREVGLAVPRLMDKDGGPQETVAYLMTPATELRSSARRRARERLRSVIERGEGFEGFAYFSGAALMVRREAFEAVGGFDESIFLYFEDADLCERIAERGWRMRYVPECEIVHLGGASTRDLPVGAAIEMMRSRIRFIAKHYGRRAALAVGCANLAGRMRRLVLNSLGVVLTLGLSPGLRKKARLNGALCLWFALGMPSRHNCLYRALFHDWHAHAPRWGGI